MFDTSRIHPMLDKVQIYLGQWLEDHLKQIRPVDWWERCVLDVLVPEQRENVINDGAKNPSELDLSTQISVFRGNWLSLRRKFHLDPQLYDDAISVKRIRNKYSHKKSSENYESRFDHNLETVRLFLKGLGASIPETEEGELKKEGNAMDNLMTFDNIIEAARTALPDNIRRAPWIGLEHGVVPLDTEQKLDQYLAAYGKMHAEKIRMALNSLDDPEMLLSEPVSVVDWGCGQGLASCCLFDWLLNKKIDIDCISRVHLIEPSNLALQRAQSNIARYKKGYNCQFDVKTVNKVINNIQSDDFDICNINTTLHLFSNILDIETVDLKFLSKFITNTFTGRQIFCCVGPHNNGAPRITEFAGTFGITQAQIQAKCVGKLSHSKGTVCLLTFVIDIGKASIVKEARLDPASAVIEDNIALQRLLKRYTPEKDVLDRILQFYQMTTELEQLKEPEVKNSTPFVMGLNGDSIIVSFKNNCNDNDTTPFAAACRSFAEECDENTNRENRFPKDILCSLEIDLGGKIYRLLHYIKPVSELEGFDYKNDDFVIPLRDFALNIAATEALNISDQDVTALEQVLHSDNVTLNDIEAQIINVIGLPATFNKKHIELSLCQKSTTLLQTRAELKKIKAYSVFRNPLLEAFLKNAEIDNNIEPILPDELISAVPMDSSQRKAVAHALGNHVSVIIGPPGCGKTQLLLNLLANALVRGKKVLVASKNNKAVDNVCDRFKTFDEDGCFLRFGPKKYTKDKTLPVLSNLLNCVQAKNYDDTEYMEVDAEFRKAIDAVKAREGLEADLVKHRDGLASDQEDIVGLCNEIEAANKALKKIREECIAEIRVRFETKYQNQCNAVREYETRIVGLEREIDLERERLMRELDDFKEMHIGCASLEKFDYDALFAFIVKLQRIGSDIEYRIGGLRGIFVRKATIAKCVLDAVSELPWSIQEYLREVDTRCNIGDFDSRHDVVSYCGIMVAGLRAVLKYRKDLEKMQDNSLNTIARIEAEIKRTRSNKVKAGSMVAKMQEILSSEEHFLDWAEQQYRNDIEERQAGVRENFACLEECLERKTRHMENEQSCISKIETTLKDNAELIERVSAIDFGQHFVKLALAHYSHAPNAARAISAYKAFIPDQLWMGDAVEPACHFLDVIHLNSVTSLSVRNAFPMAENLFDMLVIDEASQCDVASALPLILRAKQIVVIGDPMQLRHISQVKEAEELAIKRHLKISNLAYLKYAKSSLWDFARNWIPWCGNDSPCVLRNHYRCHPDIIGYSNEMFYRDLGGLKVCTPERKNGPDGGIIWIDVNGRHKSDHENCNSMEANQCVTLAIQYSQKYPGCSIGIVTPFKDQVKLINSILDKHLPVNMRDTILVDTAHSFQGDERDVIIYSLVVTNNSLDRKIKYIDIKESNLVNVAVTRARQKLVIVGNRTYIKRHSQSKLPLGHLELYVSVLESAAAKKAAEKKAAAENAMK